jgi:hypothetical protein
MIVGECATPKPGPKRQRGVFHRSLALAARIIAAESGTVTYKGRFQWHAYW